jgi:hypothetical protein
VDSDGPAQLALSGAMLNRVTRGSGPTWSTFSRHQRGRTILPMKRPHEVTADDLHLVAHRALHRTQWRINRHVLTVEQLGDAIVIELEDAGIKAGTFFNTVDGQVVSAAAAKIVPPGYGIIFDDVVAGLRHAAWLQQQGRRKDARKTAGTWLVGGGSAALVSWSLGRALAPRDQAA